MSLRSWIDHNLNKLSNLSTHYLVPKIILEKRSESLLERWFQTENAFCEDQIKRVSILAGTTFLFFIPLDMTFNNCQSTMIQSLSCNMDLFPLGRFNPNWQYSLTQRGVSSLCFYFTALIMMLKLSAHHTRFVIYKAVFLASFLISIYFQHKYSFDFPDRIRVFPPILAALAVSFSRIGPYTATFVFLSQLAMYFYFFSTGERFVEDLNYQIIGFVITYLFKNNIEMEARKVSKIHEAELAKIEQETALHQQKKEHFKNLVQILCHDVSNPLTVTIGAKNSLLRHLRTAPDHYLPSDYKKFEGIIGKLERSTNRINSIIDQVRELEAVEDGKIHLDLKAVDLKKVIENSLLLLNERISEKNIQVKVNVQNPEQAYLVLADQKSLENSVIHNLISNAIKFVSPDTGLINIHVYEPKPDQSIRLEISDNGIGIPQELAKNIFRKDVQTSRLGTSGEVGTGFGLPLVKVFVDRYEANISLKSLEQNSANSSHGTTFCIDFQKAAKTI